MAFEKLKSCAAWQECKALAACEIRFRIEEYPASVEADMPEGGFAKLLSKLAEVCDQLDTLTPSILAKLKLVCWWHFRELHGKAEDGLELAANAIVISQRGNHAYFHHVQHLQL